MLVPTTNTFARSSGLPDSASTTRPVIEPRYCVVCAPASDTQQALAYRNANATRTVVRTGHSPVDIRPSMVCGDAWWGGQHRLDSLVSTRRCNGPRGPRSASIARTADRCRGRLGGMAFALDATRKRWAEDRVEARWRQTRRGRGRTAPQSPRKLRETRLRAFSY